MNTDIIALDVYSQDFGNLSGYNDFLSIKDLAEIFGVSKNTIGKELKEGKFGKPFQIGRTYRIPKLYIIKHFNNA